MAGFISSALFLGAENALCCHGVALLWGAPNADTLMEVIITGAESNFLMG